MRKLMIVLIVLSTAAGLAACVAPAAKGSVRNLGNQHATKAQSDRDVADATVLREAENRRILNAAWAAETNGRLNAERLPNQLAAIYGAPHDDPDAILLRFIAAQNAIQGGLGLNFATGAS